MYERRAVKVKLLLVEDDADIVKNLTEFLKTEGFDVYSTATQSGAVKLLEENDFDIALLDISLTEGNGYSLCMQIKATKDVPVIFVSASGDEYSVVAGLDMGADDYIAKPFRPRELVSRIRSVLRRSGKTQAVLEIGDVKVDTVKGLVTKGGREVFLSALEYRIFLVFLSNRGKVLTRQKLLEEVWDIGGEFVNDNTLTVYIKRIREKIEDDPRNPTVIKTVRGLGYKVGE
ncbi:MAG: response regulator transcription factor [Oscillospiraceae bacterium]|nr:response regulator transcription factor [Oscillospiraceae bacterium]